MSKRAVVKASRFLFAAAGLAFMAAAFARTWDGSVAEVAIAWWRLPVAGLLALVGLRCAFHGWATLIGGAERRALAWGFFLSQLGKYIPGGIWQAIGQVGYTTQANVSVPRATTGFAVFSLTQAAAGALVGSTVAVLMPELPPLLRVASLCGLLLCLLLHRRWMVLGVRVVRRLRDHDDAEGLVPSQRRILVAALWSVGTMVSTGAAFAVLLAGLSPGTPPAAAAAAGALAWTVGFLAIPFPSGLGVREAALIALLGPVVGTAGLIVASVYHRLVTIAAEAVMIMVSRWRPPSVEAAAPGDHPSPSPQR